MPLLNRLPMSIQMRLPRFCGIGCFHATLFAHILSSCLPVAVRAAGLQDHLKYGFVMVRLSG